MELKRLRTIAYLTWILHPWIVENLAIAAPQTVRPKFPLESAMTFEEMVGKYTLASGTPNIGNCNHEILATTRDRSNDSSVWQIGIVGFSAKATETGLRVVPNSQQAMTYALTPMDPGMSYRFGNEFAQVRCSGFSCNEYGGEVWVARAAFQRAGSFSIDETVNGTQTLSCHYTKTLAPNSDMRGTWKGSLYPTYAPGSFSHYYDANFDISCTDEGRIEGTSLLEVRGKISIYDRVFALLGGTCERGKPATVFVYANLLRDGKIRVKGPFRMTISTVAKSGTKKYWKNENYSVDVFDASGELFGNLSKPTATDLYRNL